MLCSDEVSKALPSGSCMWSSILSLPFEAPSQIQGMLQICDTNLPVCLTALLSVLFDI